VITVEYLEVRRNERFESIQRRPQGPLQMWRAAVVDGQTEDLVLHERTVETLNEWMQPGTQVIECANARRPQHLACSVAALAAVNASRWQAQWLEQSIDIVKRSPAHDGNGAVTGNIKVAE
jgi:hypothetical protein